jgi:hypothetical protein
MHSDPKFGWRCGGVSNINARKKVQERHSGLCHAKNFWNGVLARSIKSTPLDMSISPMEVVNFHLVQSASNLNSRRLEQ